MLPVLSYAIWRERMNEPRGRFKLVLERHHAGILAVILLAVGLTLLIRAA